jgi:hypothetical protein
MNGIMRNTAIKSIGIQSNTVWWRMSVTGPIQVSTASKEYRKRNASGAVCDAPRIAVGPGVLTEL